MARTRIKICGITSVEDALAAVDAGADALGFVFYAPSSRAVTIPQVAKICAALPAFVARVALFVDAEREFIEDVLGNVSIDLLQFHGSESAEFCGQFSRPFMKAIRVRPETDIVAEVGKFTEASAVLVDAFDEAQAGGSGKVFDWTQIPKELANKLVLAGGLSPDNVNQAISQLRPYAVDVSSGVEVKPGIKDPDKLQRFCNAVFTADQARNQ